jgi:hypothetical protein
MRSLSPAALDEQPIKLTSAPNDVSLYWLENVAIMAWHTKVTAPVIEALHVESEPRRKRYPTGMSFVHIGRVEYAMMDAATRDAFVRLGRELGTYTVATAIVAGASGFLASTLRSIATGILVMSNQHVELRFHAKAEEVAEWLPEKHERGTGVKLDPERLRRLLVRAESGA